MAATTKTGRSAKSASAATSGSAKRPPSVSAAAATQAVAGHVSAEAPAAPAALRRVSKGRRPQFHDSEAVDQLFAIVTALTAEVSVAFDRIDTLERVLTESGTVSRDAVESYQPTEAAAEARGAKREELIQRVFAVFEAYGLQNRA